MTPSQIETMARRKLNLISDDFVSSTEIIEDYLYEACLDAANRAHVIQKIYTTNTVVSQKDYPIPTYAVQIKRILYDSRKLAPVNLRERDAVDLAIEEVTSVGRPRLYTRWEDNIELYPTPEAVKELKMYTLNEPAPITAASTLEIPTEFHGYLVDRVCMHIAFKEGFRLDLAEHYRNQWEGPNPTIRLGGHLETMRKLMRKKFFLDRFGVVKNEENFENTDIVGIV